MKKTKYYSVIVISIIIIIHLIATFLKVNADYFKYNYKFDEAEIVEAEVAYRQRRSIKQSSDRINLWFEYDRKTHSQECWRGLLSSKEIKRICMW